MNDPLGELLRTWIRVLGPPLPRDLVQLYATMAQAFWFGHKRPSDEPIRKRGKRGHGFWFGDWSLFGVKTEVDAEIRAVEAELRRWERGRSAQGVQGSGRGRDEDQGRAQA